MPTPSVRPYREAQLAARALMGDLDRRSATAILEALDAWATGIEAALAFEGRRRSQLSLRRTLAILEDLSRQLESLLILATEENRVLTFREVLELWRESGARAAATVGVPLAAFGGVATPPLTLLGAFESANSPVPWRTLIRGHVANAREEVARIVRLGLVENVGPDELARRIRRYVQGAEPLQDLFVDVPTRTGTVSKIDLRKVPRQFRGQARQMKFNAERIAFSEVHNARHEAEVQHLFEDPLVAAVRWRLSPDRGSLDPPDECDVLATADYYGMGPGIYPVDKVPGIPHPFDRCENEAVVRSSLQMDQPKRSPARVLAMTKAEVPSSRRLSRKRIRRIQAAADSAVRLGPEALARRRRAAA